MAGDTLSSYIVDSSSPSIPKWSFAFLWNKTHHLTSRYLDIGMYLHGIVHIINGTYILCDTLYAASKESECTYTMYLFLFGVLLNNIYFRNKIRIVCTKNITHLKSITIYNNNEWKIHIFPPKLLMKMYGATVHLHFPHVYKTS